MKAVLLISHGSHSPKTKREVLSLLKKLRTKTKIKILEHAFLEIEKPRIAEGIEHCIQKGATGIVILLNFLNSGQHVDRDIPKIIRQAKARHPQIKFTITKPVGQHPRIAELFLEMIK